MLLYHTVFRCQLDKVKPAVPDGVEFWLPPVDILLQEEGGDVPVTGRAHFWIVRLGLLHVR